MLEWIPVLSSMVTAIAYDAESLTIFAEFPSGARWWYAGCDSAIWTEFADPATSKGQYIHRVLDSHPNGQYSG